MSGITYLSKIMNVHICIKDTDLKFFLAVYRSLEMFGVLSTITTESDYFITVTGNTFFDEYFFAK